MNCIVLCSGLLVRDGRLLLVRSAYSGEPEPLWALPGGRQEPGETVAQAVVREFQEETGLRVRAAALAYVSESIDPHHDLHVTNCTFRVVESDTTRDPMPSDPRVSEARFVPVAETPALLRADVLRIPVSAALSGVRHAGYFSFRAEQIETPFFSAPAPAGQR